MKPALVLGLALAANAMTADQGDNELIVAPTEQFGVKKFHGHIMYDEQADDELLVRPLRPTYLQVADDELLAVKKPREESKMTEKYKEYLFGKRHYQAADDELIIAPTDEFGRIKPYPRNIKFDEQADDELLIRPVSTRVADDELIIAPTDDFGRIKQYPPYIRFDEDGNEFFVAPTHRLGEVGHRILYDEELAARAGEMKELLEKEFAYKGRFDDEADAELMMAPLDGTGRYNRRRFDDLATRKVYDDEADTELMRAPYDRRRGHDDVEGRKVYDDEADTELMMAPLDGTGRYNRRRFDDLTTRKVYDDEADTELMMAPYRRRFDDIEGRKVYDDEADSELIRAPTDEFGRIMRIPGHIMYDEQADEELFKKPTSHEDRPKHPTMKPTLFVNRPNAETVRNDDEGDDELAYLGELIKHHKMDRFRDHELPEIKTRKPLSGGFLGL